LLDIRQAIDRAKTRWSELPARRKILIGLVVATIPAILISLAIWSNKPDYTVLFTNLSPEDAQALEDELNAGRIPYKLSEGGKTILVPSSDVYKTRMRLANKGLPEASSSVGYEGFDKTDFGTTDFVQKLKYQRALQVELTRTITQIKEVSAARVHIVLPKETIFSEKEQSAKASVVLKLRPGTTLNESQVSGIVHLIASAVENLDKDNVTVIDNHGNVLSAAGQNVFLSDSQLKYKKNVENELQQKVQGMLDKVLGPNKSTVQVAAEIELVTTETSSETYDPEKTVVKSEQNTDYSSNGGATPSGVPGVSASITPNTQVGGNLAEYKGSDTNTEYEISKITQKTVEPPGKIKKMSVAVVVDNKIVEGNPVAWTQLELGDIKNIVKNAVGFDLTRGDPEIEVKNIPFDTSLQQELDGAEKTIKSERLREMIIKAAIAIAIIGLLVFILMMIFRAGRKTRLNELDMGTAQPLMLDQPPQVMSAIPRLTETEAEPVPQLNISPIQKQKQEILDMMERDPDSVIQLIRDWMSRRLE
jgi:flagellar M-ring protein FliF